MIDIFNEIISGIISWFILASIFLPLLSFLWRKAMVIFNPLKYGNIRS